MAKFKKRPVIPSYAIALVWVIFTLVHPLYRVSDYVTVILLSAVVFIVAKGIFPTISYEMPDPQPQAAPSASEEEPPAQDAAQEAQEEAPSSTGDPKIDALIQEKDRALQEMRRLNDAIEDEIISRRIDQLEDTTGKIIDQVVAHPEKLSQIRTFMNYYLPTTLKILNAYDRMGAAGVSGENIDSTMQRIETMMDTIVMAFHKQLDALFRDDAMDIASDITVLENLLAQEGLGGARPDQGQAAAAPAPAAASTPPAEAHLPESDLDEAKLSPAQRKAVEDFARTIDITDSNVVLQYGAAAQKNVSEFSENTLQQIRTKDLGQIGETLADLVRQLQEFDPEEEKKGFAGFFRRKKNQLAALKAGYAKASANVDQIVENLQAHQITLMKDVANLDQMFELNAKYQQELTMYILAGKQRLAQIQREDLAQLQQQAAASGTQADAQAYNDMVSLCNRFEKKLHDLELTRMISLQMGPQTRMLQNNDTLMIEKIQSSLVNTIPLWKSQMVLALGLEHARQATAAQNAVTEMTNNLLRQNADLLKTGTIDTAREAERSIVDLETLRHTNQQLMESLDEVLRIQTEGTHKRREAEAELGRIEGELKQKLLALRT